MQKILITGSSGFIGQHLLERFANHYEIFCLKNDLRDHAQVRQEVLDVQPELVVHLAARTEVESSFYEQATFSEINYVGTVNLIESLLACAKIPKIIFASTMEVYGWQPISDQIKNGAEFDKLPVFTADTVPNPNAPYAVAKLASEKYIEYAHRSFGLPYVILRQTNTYGRKDNDFFVVEQIITQMLQGDQCNLGYRKPYRNFLYINDMVDAWSAVIENFDACANRIFTLGPNNCIRIEKLAEKIAHKLGWSGQINWDKKPARPGEIYLLNSSEQDLQQLTGWAPKIDLNQGLDKTIEIWKRNLKHTVS